MAIIFPHGVDKKDRILNDLSSQKKTEPRLRASAGGRVFGQAILYRRSPSTTWIEIVWRGYTHWSMFLVGGACFHIMERIQNSSKIKRVFSRCALCSAAVTVVEFCQRLYRQFGSSSEWAWDYSGIPLNLHGQVCLLYTVLWGPEPGGQTGFTVCSGRCCWLTAVPPDSGFFCTDRNRRNGEPADQPLLGGGGRACFFGNRRSSPGAGTGAGRRTGAAYLPSEKNQTVAEGVAFLRREAACAAPFSTL